MFFVKLADGIDTAYFNFERQTALASLFDGDIDTDRILMELGGMPEVLNTFFETKEIIKAEAVQQDILQSYELDFSKHAPHKDIPKLLLLWQSIPAQLTRKNAKFMYGEVKAGARAKDLEDALRWLEEQD